MLNFHAKQRLPLLNFLFVFLCLSMLFSCGDKQANVDEEPPYIPPPKDCNPALPQAAEGYPDPYANLEKGDWSFMGPYDWGSRVITIEMDPENPYRLYAGSASGGLWVNPDTRSAGWQWVDTDTFKVMGVKAIAIHPDDAQLMYIGTGEVYNYDHSFGGYDLHVNRGSYGIGILYSTDRGKTWSKASGLPDLQKLGIQDIEIATRASGTQIWAATTEGVYHSEDGENFVQSLKEKMVTSLSINPDNPNEIVAAVGNLNSPNAGIYLSNDNGKNWKEVLAREPSEFMGKTELTRSASNPQKLYAAMGTWNPLYFYNNVDDPANKIKKGDCIWPEKYPHNAHNWVYSSADGGSSWTLENDTTTFSSGQGHYSMAVAVSPEDENYLLFGGIYPVQNSKNGGSVISPLDVKGTSGLNSECLPAAMGNFDIHQFLFGPSADSLIYICSDQGVYMSTNNLKSAHRINKNLAIMQFYPRMAFSDDSTNILFGCAQDYGPGSLSYMGVDDSIGRARWELLYGYGHEAGYCLYDDANEIGYMSIHLGAMIARKQMKPGAPVIDPPDIKEGNGAFNYIPDLSPFNQGDLCYQHTSWNTPIAFSPSNPNVIYAGKDILYRSEKQPGDAAAGKVWEAPNKDGEGLDGNPIHQLAVSSEDHENIFIATAPRYTDMHLFHSLDGGKTWTNITGSNLPKQRNPSYLSIDPNDTNTLYLTFEEFGAGRAWKGTKEGDNWSWTAIDQGLPDTFTRAITADPSNAGHLYVATDHGIYKSTDAGNSWEKFSSGLPAAIEGVQLILHNTQRKLRLVSHGNGVWERSI